MMSLHTWQPAIMFTVIICAIPNAFSMQQPDLAASTQRMEARIAEVHTATNNCVARINESMGLAHSANGTAIRSHETSTQALERANEVLTSINNIRQELEAAQRAGHDIQGQIRTFNTTVTQAVREAREQATAEYRASRNTIDMEHTLQAARAQVREMQNLGVYEQQERIRAQASIDATTTQWNSIKQMLGDPKFMAKIICALTVLTLGYYIAKHSVPILMAQLTQPRVISETSKSGWFGGNNRFGQLELGELIFNASVQEQLFNLVMRIQSAKTYNDNLPNVLLFGPPGTGKTAFIRALAEQSEFDYALTSGSEFAKITDLHAANDELRNLIEWAKNSSKLIVFIDEVESFLPNRTLATTSKSTQDLVNTFLALTQDMSSKDVMFVFATNHPYKLDPAVLNRIGVHIEVGLPEEEERALILAMYLKKFSQENSNAVVYVHPEVINNLAVHAQALEGFSPRSLKFVAEEMIVAARQQEIKQLTNAIAQTVIDRAKRSQKQLHQWEIECDAWINTQNTALACRAGA